MGGMTVIRLINTQFGAFFPYPLKSQPHRYTFAAYAVCHGSICSRNTLRILSKLSLFRPHVM